MDGVPGHDLPLCVHVVLFATMFVDAADDLSTFILDGCHAHVEECVVLSLACFVNECRQQIALAEGYAVWLVGFVRREKIVTQKNAARAVGVAAILGHLANVAQGDSGGSAQGDGVLGADGGSGHREPYEG